jgi:hypothetical protein
MRFGWILLAAAVLCAAPAASAFAAADTACEAKAKAQGLTGSALRAEIAKCQRAAKRAVAQDCRAQAKAAGLEGEAAKKSVRACVQRGGKARAKG